MKYKIFGINSLAEINVYKFFNAKIKKYQITCNNKAIAYADTEEKARMYAEAFDQGISIGYSLGLNNIKG